MSNLDWGVMIGATLFIIAYGIWKSRGTRTMRAYLLSDKGLKWWMVGLSIMATQASAITFLSTPGQAFDDGMRFVQFYFGVPIAMVLISMFAIPIYHRLNVYTAYEYLEGRFDLKTRALATWLFLLSRGLSTGLTLYAPAIIFSSLLGWDIRLTCIATGLLVMAYIVSGGNEAVNQTQKQQLLIALAGMVIAGIVMVQRLPADISLGDAVYIGGKMGKLNAFTLPDWGNFDWKDRYNLFSGLIGGTFLALSYFGTDQSQVQRYLGGRSLAESRIGLMFNGMLKAPMQFGILFLGVIMFVFFQFEDRPLFFQEKEVIRVYNSPEGEAYRQLEQQNEQLQEQKQSEIRLMLDAREKGDRAGEEQRQKSLTALEQENRKIRKEAQSLIKKSNPAADLNDNDRVFLTFVIQYMPKGLVGLLMAVILATAMSSISAAISSLSTTTVIDVYRRSIAPDQTDAHYVKVSRFLNFGWCVLCILIALLAGNFGNLIQAVNILGSLFYGTLLGIFMVGFFLRNISGTAVFWAALVSELLVVALFILPAQAPDLFGWLDIGYLWYNLIGCLCVMGLGGLVQLLLNKQRSKMQQS